MLTGVLNQFAASFSGGESDSDLQQQMISLSQLLQVDEKAVDTSPLMRRIVATGIAALLKTGPSVRLERKAVLSAVFAGSFKRCALLWKLLLKELEASSWPQRLLLKLDYCHRFCIRAFNTSPLDTKRLLVSENAVSITFGLDLSVAVLQGTYGLLCTCSLIHFLCTRKASNSYIIINLLWEKCMRMFICL